MVVTAHRKTAGLAQESRRERFGLGGNRGRPFDRHQRHAQLIRQRRQNVAHGHEAHVDQRFAELVAALFLQLERALQILIGDELALNQDFAEAHESELLDGEDARERRPIGPSRFDIHQRPLLRVQHNLRRQALGVFAAPVEQRNPQRDLFLVRHGVQATRRS